MALFATLERDTPEPAKLITLAHLASDYKDQSTAEPYKELNVIVFGYLTSVAATDAVKESIERDLMRKSISSISKSLVEYGIPIDVLYIGDYVFSDAKARKIDIFLQQQGESATVLPTNPPIPGKTVTPSFPKPVKDAELTINNNRELVMEVTAYKISSGRRTLVPELAFKSSTGISPVEISKGFSAQLTMWKPKLEALLRKIGQEGNADKIEFAVQIIGSGAMTKEFARQISIEVAASLKVALTFNITVPVTKRELPIELSYSYGTVYQGGSFSNQGQGMITVTLFRFNSW